MSHNADDMFAQLGNWVDTYLRIGIESFDFQIMDDGVSRDMYRLEDALAVTTKTGVQI